MSAVAGFSGLSLLTTQVLAGEGVEAFQTGILLAVCVFVLPLALSVAGLLCRGRYGVARLASWTVVSVLAVSLMVVAPFFVLAMMSSSGGVPVKEFLIGVLVLAGVNLGVLLPFLILSLTSGFHRERLKALLHLGAGEAAPVIAPAKEHLAVHGP